MVEHIKGRWPANKPLPDECHEMMLVATTGWTLDYIRSMPIKQYKRYISFGNLQYDILLAGAQIDRSGKGGDSGGKDASGFVKQYHGQNAETVYEKIEFNA